MLFYVYCTVLTLEFAFGFVLRLDVWSMFAEERACTAALGVRVHVRSQARSCRTAHDAE